MTGIIGEVMNGFWMIDKQSANSYLHLVANIMKGNQIKDPSLDMAATRLKNLPRFATFANDTYSISEYGGYSSPEEAPKNSIAIMEIHGAITYYDQHCGPSGMETKANIIDRIGANTNIKKLVLIIRSGGGEAYASAKLVRSLEKLEIETVAFIEDFAASAGYRIAAACDLIIANSYAARIGSIGTYVTLGDFEKFWEMQGIKIIDIYATKSKDKNQDYIQALEGNNKLMLESTDFINEAFLTEISENRNGKLRDEKIWGTGKLFFAEEALAEGLIDDISSFEDIIINLEYSINS